MDEQEILVVDIKVQPPISEQEISTLADFGMAKIERHDSVSIKYTINLTYMENLKTRMDAATALMRIKKNQISVAEATKLRAAALSIVNFCDVLLGR